MIHGLWTIDLVQLFKHLVGVVLFIMNITLIVYSAMHLKYVYQIGFS